MNSNQILVWVVLTSICIGFPYVFGKIKDLESQCRLLRKDKISSTELGYEINMRMNSVASRIAGIEDHLNISWKVIPQVERYVESKRKVGI